MKAARYWLVTMFCAGGVAAVAACSAGNTSLTPGTTALNAGTPAIARSDAASSIKQKKHGQARIILVIPRKKKPGHRMHPEYVSPSTQSMAVAVQGEPTQTFNFTAAQCATNPANGYLTCAVTAFLPTGPQTLTISLYDQKNGQGDLLSTATTTVTVLPKTVTPISLTLDGVVTSAKVLIGNPAGATLTIPEGTSTTVSVWVDAYDAKGNLIMAPGNYSTPIPLTNTDASGATTLNVNPVPGPTADVTLSYDGASLTTTTITASVNGVAQTAGAATLTLQPPLITEYHLSYGSSPYGIVTGPDQNLWFTESGGDRIGQITTSGTISEYSIPTSGAGPEGITNGPDGALWFAELRGDKIGRITTAGAITEYSIPTAASFSPNITVGPDGALWFTECSADQIGRLTTSGTFTEYAVPTAGAGPYVIASGPDGALWFTEAFAGQIGRITTGGVVTEYNVPTVASSPYGITKGPDGTLWFAEYNGNKIGQITTDGTVSEYTVPTGGSRPDYIATGSDNALWFTELNGNKIGRITTTGSITEYSVPSGYSLPNGITSGPNGTIWFTEYNGNKIGTLSISAATSSIRRRHQ